MALTKNVIEALLFAADQPVTMSRFVQLSPEPVEPASLKAMLEELSAEYEGRGVQLKEVAGGWQLCTRPEYGEWVRKFLQAEASQKLSRPALETLAIVVYRQPITKPEIEALRGVDSSGVLKTLVERRLVRVLGRKQVIGRPILYGSSREFLQYFGLKDLTDLPRPEELVPTPQEALAEEGGDLLEALEASGEALALAEGSSNGGQGEPQGA